MASGHDRSETEVCDLERLRIADVDEWAGAGDESHDEAEGDVTTPRAEEGSAIDVRFEISSSPEGSSAGSSEACVTPPPPVRPAARVRHHRRTTSSDEEFIDEWLETWAEWPSPSQRMRRRAASLDGVGEPDVWAYPVRRARSSSDSLKRAPVSPGLAPSTPRPAEPASPQTASPILPRLDTTPAHMSARSGSEGSGVCKKVGDEGENSPKSIFESFFGVELANAADDPGRLLQPWVQDGEFKLL